MKIISYLFFFKVTPMTFVSDSVFTQAINSLASLVGLEVVLTVKIVLKSLVLHKFLKGWSRKIF